MNTLLSSLNIQEVEPDRLMADIGIKIGEYQKTRSYATASYLAELFGLISRYPDISSRLVSCGHLSKLSQQWNWLATHHSRQQA